MVNVSHSDHNVEAGWQTEGAIDFSRLFMPPSLTPLYHTQDYGLLNSLQKVRYNQLQALYFNEQIMFFEEMGRQALSALLRLNIPSDLRHKLPLFIDQESIHSSLFRSLNLKCAPHIYSDSDYHFIQIKPSSRALIHGIVSYPQFFPLLFWLAHLQEERAVSFGRAFLQQSMDLEPHFVALQRKHLADEAGHVGWDEEILDWLWPKTHPWLRFINAKMLAWLIGEYFNSPKRAAVRVLQTLALEMPDLRPLEHRLRSSVLALSENQNFRVSLYNKTNVPRTFKRFDSDVLFQCLSQVMPGYQPSSSS
jgi:hypothetical protein